MALEANHVDEYESNTDLGSRVPRAWDSHSVSHWHRSIDHQGDVHGRRVVLGVDAGRALLRSSAADWIAMFRKTWFLGCGIRLDAYANGVFLCVPLIGMLQTRLSEQDAQQLYGQPDYTF
jgi:hypothetical protein